MDRSSRPRRLARVTYPIVVTAACLALAACGGSSSTSSSATSTTSNAPATSAQVTSAAAAATSTGSATTATATAITKTPTAKSAHAALSRYAACMRRHGVNLPPPNTTGNGPLFNLAGINTGSPAFQAAAATCRKLLVGAL